MAAVIVAQKAPKVPQDPVPGCAFEIGERGTSVAKAMIDAGSGLGAAASAAPAGSLVSVARVAADLTRPAGVAVDGSGGLR